MAAETLFLHHWLATPMRPRPRLGPSRRALVVIGVSALLVGGSITGLAVSRNEPGGMTSAADTPASTAHRTPPVLLRPGPSDGGEDQSALGPVPLPTAAAKGSGQSDGPASPPPSPGAAGGGGALAQTAPPRGPANAGAAAGQAGQLGGAPAATPAPPPNAVPNQTASAAPPPPATVTLVRYNNGPDHAALTGPAPAGYQSEGVLGSVYQSSGVPGTRPLYACWAGSDSFTSAASNCEGQQVAGVLGWIYGSAPSTPATRAIIRCNTGRGDHFVSLDRACEGLVVEGVQGYVIVG
ncbi:hypothetical protein [Pseudofrankia sp. BMG5.36]|uniref:hypothetical protein n=1 Tax=Pseudofrankia sp. BMG5.36 TaxID=1834512 RepID=UPI0008DA5A35|nr:hypothetical protein [Pseudofrankia sp. BMG5.36]OHV73016.1 hypothetical protein BCD48_33870 [Pseudofrankia sp. BMG5.36]